MIVLLLFTTSACSILSPGRDNNFGQYVPKRENFKLNKSHFEFKGGFLDTSCYYELIKKQMKNSSYAYDNINSEINFKSFYYFKSNGQCYDIIFYKSDTFRIDSISLFLMKNKNTRKCVYRFIDNRSIKIETFFNNQGIGEYLIQNLYFSDNADTLYLDNDYELLFYVRRNFE